jgi:hypothetical protein
MSQVYLARESFDYPLGATIDTLMGGAANGWAGSWYKIVAPQANAAVAADTGLVYDDLNYPVSNAGKHLETVPDPTGTEQRYGRHLDKTWPNEAGRTYWISFIMNVKNATDNATWLGVKYYNGDAGELAMLGKGHGLDKYTCGSGWHGGEGAEVSAVTWSEGPVWQVGKTVMHGAASSTVDTTYMWISPDPAGGEPSIATANAVALTNMKGGFNTIRIEFGGSVGDGLGASFDELRLGTSWGDVSSPLLATAVTQRRTELPTQFVLSQNYPNPFNPSTTISYTLKRNGKVRLTVYDIIGREVTVLVDGVQSAGKHEIMFSGADLPSGIYFYRLETGNEVFAKKMALVK